MRINDMHDNTLWRPHNGGRKTRREKLKWYRQGYYVLLLSNLLIHLDAE
jgi:hypothetical protein